MRRRTLLDGAVLGAAAPPALAAGAARAADPGPSVTRTGSTTLDRRALFFVSYDGLVNNNSFQKNGLLTYKGHQCAVWYTADRNAVIGRRALGSPTWSTLEAGHTLKADDSHNVMCLGVSEVDGRLHLAMDAHSDGFTYVKSVAGLRDPAGLSWTASRFGAPRSSLDGDGADPAAFGEVVVDETRVPQDGILSFIYQETSTGTTPSLLHVVDFRLPS